MSAFYQVMRSMRQLFKQHSLLLKTILCLFCLINESAVTHATEKNNQYTSSKVDSFVQSVLQKSEDMQLSQHESWFALLHYKKETVSRSTVSQADDGRFFLNRDGKTNAHAELTADIIAFLRGAESDHAQCRFPARWWWLKQQLKLSSDNDVRCPQLEYFMLNMPHDKLYLVFPTMYLNNPGSTFGHTFLRFDESDAPILLSRTLNYAARVDERGNIFSHVSRGVFGGYKGIFKTRQYFEMVQEYSDIDSRDIWEYQLSFTSEEVEQLVRHVWEVRDIDFDYYFFRENCAYRLLALMDVMRPGLLLTNKDKFSLYAIPVDTIRALDDEDLILNRKFRASLVTKIDNYFINEGNATFVQNIISKKTPSDKENILQLLQDLPAGMIRIKTLQQSYNILQLYGETSSEKSQTILQLINEITSQSTVVVKATAQEKISPEKGHDAIRLAAGYGKQNERRYIDIKFRPNFHDLLDSPKGYVDGAAINIFELRLKFFDDNNLRLESLSIINSTSLRPLRPWSNPVSWLFDLRFDHSQISKTESIRNFVSRGGIGVSAKWHSVKPFVLLMAEWDLSSSYTKGYSLLIGAQLGLHYNYHDNQLMLQYEKLNSVSGLDFDKSITQAQWQYNFQVNHAVRFSYKVIDYDYFNDEDWTVAYQYYF